jgi:hypothetical protein
MTLTAEGNPYGIIGPAPVVIPGVRVDAITTMGADGRVTMAFNTNPDGTFFSDRPDSPSSLPASQARAATLIHELAHAARFLFGPDASKLLNDDPAVDPTGRRSRDNQIYVEEKCFR